MGKKQSIRSAVIGGLVGALVVMTLPAIGAVLNQSVGDPLSLGNVNRIDDRTDLKGAAKGANLQIKNTGNSRALSVKADKIPLLAKATSGPVALSAKASRNAIKIKVDDGQAPIKVNPGAGTATNLSADQVDGYDANQLNRAYGEELGVGNNGGEDEIDDFAETEYTTILSDSLTAPAGGLFQITATLSLSDDCTDASSDPFVSATLFFTEEGESAEQITDHYNAYLEDCDPTDGDIGGRAQTMTIADVVSVPEGTHTVELRLRTSAGDHVFVYAANVTAVFSPAGSAGGFLFLPPFFPTCPPFCIIFPDDDPSAGIARLPDVNGG